MEGGVKLRVLRKMLRAEDPGHSTEEPTPGYGQAFADTTSDSFRGGSTAPLFSGASLMSLKISHF